MSPRCNRTLTAASLFEPRISSMRARLTGCAYATTASASRCGWPERLRPGHGSSRGSRQIGHGNQLGQARDNLETDIGQRSTLRETASKLQQRQARWDDDRDRRQGVTDAIWSRVASIVDMRSSGGVLPTHHIARRLTPVHFRVWPGSGTHRLDLLDVGREGA